MKMKYAELHCLSNFSFLRGASRPQELVRRAHELGYKALAITDECSLAGVVRAHEQAKICGLQLIIGTELKLIDGMQLLLLASNRQGYAQLCRLITKGRRGADKGQYVLSRDDLQQHLQDCLALWLAPVDFQIDPAELSWFKRYFDGRGWLSVSLLRDGLDDKRLQQLQTTAATYDLPLVATGRVCMHVPERRPVRDLLSAIRHHKTLETLGKHALFNAERHLRELDDLRGLYPQDCLEQSVEIARRCCFSLDLSLIHI